MKLVSNEVAPSSIRGHRLAGADAPRHMGIFATPARNALGI